MRIAVIGMRSSAEGCHDGVQTALKEICPRLAARGHEIDLFSDRNGRAFTGVDGARLIRLPSFVPGLGEAAGHAALSSVVTAFRGYDIVNFFASEAAGLFSLAAKMGLHKVVVSVHGLAGERLSGTMLAPSASVARFADAVVVASRRIERFFRKTYGRETIYIPNGIKPAQAPPPELLRPFGLERESYLLAADRLIPESGLHLAVLAMKHEKGPRLVVVETGRGDDDYAAALRREAEPGRVLFLNGVGVELLDALMAHAYLIVLPSQAEEPPAILPAALAHGRAMVVSDQPEHLDMVGPDAFTFTSGDVGDLKRVIAWLLDDREVVERMRARAAATVASRYCWDRIAERYEQVYASIL